MATCRLCGAEIRWIRTKGGAKMPCNPEKVYYRLNGSLNERIVTSKGEVITCRTMNPHTDNIRQADGWGYVPHFATCRGGIDR